MDKEALFVPRLPEGDVEVPGIGTVRVRGLSRIEAIHVQAVNGAEARERRILSLGMLDPTLTEAEAGQWQKASTADEIEAVTTKIAELSGVLAGAHGEAYKSGPGGSGASVRVLPGAEAGPDAGPTPTGDE